MLGIIIPLKSKVVSEDWEVTSNLLYQTIISVLGQTNDQYKFIVVGHEKPVLPIEYPFLECPLELPKWEHVEEPIAHYKQIDYILDKTRKIVLGLQYMKQYPIDYFFVLDADDILHQSFVTHILQEKHPYGYILKSGYEYYLNTKKILLRNDIEKRCGSTTVIHQSLVIVPTSINDTEVWEHPWGKSSHGDMESYFNRKGKPLLSLKMPLVLYTLNHGQNASNEFRQGWIVEIKRILKELILSKKVTNTFKKTFSLI